MASREAVGKALALLGVTFARDITPELVAVWLDVFADVEDDTLGRATRRALATCRFFPVPAEMRGLVGVNRAPIIDAEAVLEQVRGLSDYHPSRGTTAPSVEAARRVFGDAIGEAYGLAGGGLRLFSGNETTASIARRDFSRALSEAVAVHGVPPVPAPQLRSGADEGAIVYDDRPRVGSGGLRRIGGGE